MRWQGGRESRNVEDRRGARLGGGGFGGGMLGVPLGRGGLGIGGIAIVLIVSLVLGIDPMMLLGGGETMSPQSSRTSSGQSAGDDDLKRFVSVVLADTEDTWHALFREAGGTYAEPTLVLFSGAVQSACGRAGASVGPFYCPGDRKVYIDLSFYRDLRDRFRAPGDFAQAYVIAHEVGHHVQNLLGIAGKVHSARQGMSEREGNALSVRLELQADCFAGVWAHHADRQRNVLEPGDIDEALNAASAIGDDRLQEQSRGYVTPDSFTHGSSAQRVQWFRTGFTEGRMQACDTFR